MTSMRLRPAPGSEAHPDDALDDAADILDVLAAASAKPAADKAKAVLSIKRLNDEEVVSKSYRASAETGTPWSRVLEPGYWVSVSSRLRPGDVVSVAEDSLKYFGMVICTSCFATRVAVSELFYKELDAADAGSLELRSGFKVENRGLTEKFAIVRVRDGITMQSGIDSAEIANQLIHSQYVKAAQKRTFG